MERLIFNFRLAIEGIAANRLRAFLTALGIIFGVAAVVAMLGIGSGAQKAIMEQMKLIGANSIIIESTIDIGDDVEESEESESSTPGNGKRKWSPGLSNQDLVNIKEILPSLDLTGGEINLRYPAIANGIQSKTNCIGIEPSFFELNNLVIGEGKNFTETNVINGHAVCVIGKNIESKFFKGQSAIGERIKVGKNWLTIIGVIKRRLATKENLEKLGLQDYNQNIYIPIQTALIRFKNRSKVGKDDISNRNDFDPNHNYNQLDRVVLRVENAKELQASADLVGRYLERKHNGVKDYEIKIPELLIQQQQKTQETFNIVLAVIAGISLLVGGIGIMNIMLASVLERIKEIGIRRSIGAHKRDIILQFLFEAVFICFIGGLIGIILGVVTAKVIAQSADIPTVISWWSIVLSFGVAFVVGLVFGLFPAKRASEYDPIMALRSN
ncbi:MAG: FtsX-like permease family protein [Saprospiraceae bacterium]|nr:FtsX-like permease family protein [Saprospiraceae bacterium]